MLDMQFFFHVFFSSDMARGYRAVLGQCSLCLESTYIGPQPQLVKNKEKYEKHNSTCSVVQTPDPVLVCFLFKV